MTANEGFDRRLSAWLAEDAAHRVPDHLDEVLVRTVATRQRAWWSSLERWLPMDLTTRANVFSPARPGRTFAIVLLLIALLAAAVLVVGTRRQTPPPFGLARNGAVVSWQNGDIMLATSEAAPAHAIVAGPTTDIAPLLTRDGTKLAFFRILDEHTANLMLANIDGSGIRQVLNQPLTDSDWFEWSAEDDRLAIVSSVADKRVLSIVDVAAGSSDTLAVDGLEVDNDVYWLPPGGDALVFTARPKAGQDGPVAIYSIHPDGTGLKHLSRIRAEFASYNGLNVSPDGRTVAYWNYEPDGSPAGMGSRTHLFDVTTGTDRVMKFDETDEGETDLAFSPDGHHIVFQREVGDRSQMVIAMLDGSEPNRPVGGAFGLDAEPAYGFSPDGARLFVAFENQKPTYYDVATGASMTGREPVAGFGGYQRLAP